MIATKKLIKIERENETITSLSVTITWLNKFWLFIRFIKQLNTFEGEENIKLFIIFNLDNVSQRIRKVIRIIILYIFIRTLLYFKDI